MHWKWDPNKDRINRQKHLVSFDTAILALNDPLSVTDDDPYPWEPKLKPRWDVHLSGDVDQLGCAGESLSSVLGE